VSANPDDIIEMFDVDEADDLPAPSYNVAPTDQVPAVLERTVRPEPSPRPAAERGAAASDGGSGADRGETQRSTQSPDAEGPGLGPAESPDVVRRLRPLRWGLVPSWSKGPGRGAPMINARVETVASKPAFRRAFSARRCLLPADGYYEWYELAGATDAKGKPKKQPFFIHRADGAPLVMAGIYEFWKDPDPAPGTDPWLVSCSVITTTATDALGHIHDRMPMVIGPDRWAAWLDPTSTDPADALELLAVTDADQLEAYAVSTAVGSVRNNYPGLLDPLPMGA